MLFFLLYPVPFNQQNYAKQKGPETTDQLLFKLQSKFMYYLIKFDDVI